ncbi:hypothetical protein [Nonomuraea diastatica]|uniref:NifU family protein n=1 Tax=Nonomuraea diastatica TaxID=1848329 RepID=A0A4R4VXX1_9ACTN|nr:hypothetical protein [Nonomuraea diastatica]TDD10968.1 hypothetical protein E1294_45795 [Nonomuraea diastatica]
MSSPAAESAVLDGAFEKFRELMASDGYALNWSLTGRNRVVVEIVAGADACADCLVPLPVMEEVMSDALERTPYTLDHVVLPGGT